jgi:broad specificity polyphosphatase/5'/3'-nucleotidase SurE
LSKVRSIAISYGTVLHPTPEKLFEPAHILGGRIIRHIWENWGHDKEGLRTGEVDLYNVNIPLIEGLLEEEGLQVYWTQIWRNSYGRFFKAIAQPTPDASLLATIGGHKSPNTTKTHSDDPLRTMDIGTLAFKFSPDMKPLVNPAPASLPVGSDAWALQKGCASVTPIRASFAEVLHPSVDVENRLRRMKL